MDTIILTKGKPLYKETLQKKAELVLTFLSGNKLMPYYCCVKGLGMPWVLTKECDICIQIRGIHNTLSKKVREYLDRTGYEYKLDVDSKEVENLTQIKLVCK